MVPTKLATEQNLGDKSGKLQSFRAAIYHTSSFLILCELAKLGHPLQVFVPLP